MLAWLPETTLHTLRQLVCDGMKRLKMSGLHAKATFARFRSQYRACDVAVNVPERHDISFERLNSVSIRLRDVRLIRRHVLEESLHVGRVAVDVQGQLERAVAHGRNGTRDDAERKSKRRLHGRHT